MTVTAAQRPDLWARAWQFLNSNGLLAAWLVLFLFSGVVFLWFPQAPRSAIAVDGGMEDWLISVRPRLGNATDTVHALGLLSVERAIWFRLLVAGASLTLLIKTMDAADRLLRPIPSAGLTRSQTISLQTPADAVPALLKQTLDRRFRMNLWEQDGISRLVADVPLHYLGTLLLSGGGLLMAAGWLWAQTAGWEMAPIRLTEGASATVQTTGRELTLDQLHIEWGENAKLAAAACHLSLWDDGQQVAAGTINLAQDWRQEGITHYLSDIGAALHAHGQASSGEPLLLQTAANRSPVEVLTLQLPPDDSLRSFAVPDQGMVVQAEAVAPGGQPQIRIRVYQGQEGELATDTTFSDQTSILVNGSQLNLSVLPYAEFTVSYTPGRPVVAIGALLAAAGLAVAVASRPDELEATIEPSSAGTRLTLKASQRPGNGWLEGLIDRLQASPAGEGDDG